MTIIKQTRHLNSDQAGKRIDQAATELFPDYSRARLQSWIREGSLTLNGSTVLPKQRVAGGEIIRLEVELELDNEVLSQEIPIDIIAEDAHIIVINKPAGLVVHPATGHPGGTLQNGLLHFDASLAAIPRSGIVHRLDKDTSGVMVVARSLKAHNSLVSQLHDRKMGRIYRAVVHGITALKGTVEAPIGRNPHDRQRMAVVSSGRPAISHYRLLQAFEHFCHISVALETGRTHQIRVHMRHLGHPLVGDAQYGQKTGKVTGPTAIASEAVARFSRQALHARTLKLLHPQTNELCEYSAPVPDDLARLLQILETEDGKRNARQ